MFPLRRQPEEPAQQSLVAQFPNRDEPWKCKHCGATMYNIDYYGNPVAGAPKPKYVALNYNMVCSVCWDLYLILDTHYWRELEQKQPSRIQTFRFERLSPLSDYLSCF